MKMKKWPFVLGGIFLVVLTFPFWGGVVIPDIDPIDDSDLQLDLELPANNAFDALSQLGEGDALSLLDEASQADGYLDPALMDMNSIDDFLTSITGFVDAIELSVERAKQLDEEEALLEIERSLIVTQMMMDAPGSLIEYLVAHTAKEQLLLVVGDMDLDLDLEAYSDNKTGLINAIKVEYMMQKFAVDFAEDFDTWRNEIHPNRTKKILAENARAFIALLDVPCEEDASAGVSFYDQGTVTFNGVNALGEVLVYQLTPRIEGARDKMCELDNLL